MGHTRWSDDLYRARVDDRVKTGASAFDYSDRVVKTTGVKKCHDEMNPNGVTRESCDSDTHPNSVPVGVLFDVTGSMRDIPRVLQKKLPALMGMLIRRGFLSHPHVLFGAIGDATCDYAPLQVGQFEAGLEMDDDLGKLYLEGGGGGQNTESYELAMYFMAEHTKCDNYLKRNERGYLFIIADERPYPVLKKDEVNRIIGDGIQEDVPLETVVDNLLEKWDTYILMPSTGGAFHHDKTIKEKWLDLFGQHVIEFDPANVSEVIAGIIAASEGFSEDDINSGLDDVGASTAKASVSRAISTIVGSKVPSSVTDGAIVKSGRKATLDTI